MGKLLKFEIHKILRKKSMWICSIILVLLSLLNLATTKTMVDAGLANNLEIAIPTAYSLTVSALSSCSFSLILAIFTALFVSEDNSEGIVKNIYSKGYKRNEVYLSKIFIVSIYCVIMALICCSISFIGWLVLFPNSSDVIEPNYLIILVQIILMLAYTSLFGFISSITKKTGGAISGCIVAPMIITLVIGMVDTFLKFDNFKFSSYWLDSMYSSVNIVSATQNSLLIGIIGGLLYMAILCIAGVYVSKKNQV